jgi:ribose-phosphate pyrophosphokinase
MELFHYFRCVESEPHAASVTAVIPYYGYARQDRKVAPRAPISAKCMADLLTTAGAESRGLDRSYMLLKFKAFSIARLITYLQYRPWLKYLERAIWRRRPDFITVSPDAGGVERARAFAKRINSSLAIIDKRRSGPNRASLRPCI